MSESEHDHWTWSRSDVQLLRRAAEDPAWRIPDPLREEIIYRLGLLAGDPTTPPKTLAAVARIVAAADRNDLLKRRLDIERDRLTPPTTAAEARDAWDDVRAVLDAEERPGATPRPPGGIPAPDPRPDALE